ncbi:hypothetical protein [Mumia flava]|uniref:hypothetical protein n=1 Tax=Mumia flava TaxID=1348852 RepID=UPI000C240F21|nr:hypothetical protein [Mumia flava]
MATATLGASGPQTVMAGEQATSTTVAAAETAEPHEVEQPGPTYEQLIEARRDEQTSRSAKRESLKEPDAEIVAGAAKATAEPLEEAPEEADEPTSDFSGDACPSGSSVESGLVANAVAVHRAVCAEFPSVTSYGGVRSGDGGAHGTGQALDIMVTGSTGDAIADYVRANASSLGVSEVIWSQQIWTVERASEGWRAMSDRGSTTANHYDHVHVTVY